MDNNFFLKESPKDFSPFNIKRGTYTIHSKIEKNRIINHALKSGDISKTSKVFKV